MSITPIEKVIYTAKAHTSGGRDGGASHTSDGRLDVKLSVPGHPGSATNVQFMVKDSRKYAATGGWGFAQFKDDKPDDKAALKTCFPCHEPVKARDFVFTRYAP
jgi:hypothetical protein